jgi:AraC family transcriptional regulator, ethanolamine operon transcriptional activator
MALKARSADLSTAALRNAMSASSHLLAVSHSISLPTAIAGVVGQSLVLTDVDQLTVAFPSWDMGFIQVGAGRFHACCRVVQVPGVSSRWLQTDRTVQARGTTRKAEYVFTPITQANEGWRFRGGRRLRAGEIKIDRPGEELDDLYSAESEGLSAAIDEALLKEVLAFSSRKEPADVLSRGHAVRPTPGTFSAFRSELYRLGAARMGNLANLNHFDFVAQIRGRFLKAIACFLNGDLSEYEAEGPRGGRQDVTREAEQIIDRHLDRPLTATQIAWELCVSRRTLFYAFHEAFGVSPMAYYKVKRLHRVRSELKVADPAATTVRQVALRWGFHHSGQFSLDYKRQYGERPSETLLSKCRTNTGEPIVLRRPGGDLLASSMAERT